MIIAAEQKAESRIALLLDFGDTFEFLTIARYKFGQFVDDISEARICEEKHKTETGTQTQSIIVEMACCWAADRFHQFAPVCKCLIKRTLRCRWKIHFLTIDLTIILDGYEHKN